LIGLAISYDTVSQREYALISIHPTPMTETKAIVSIVVGSLMIYFGFTIKQFYAAKGIYGAVAGQPVARWKGRLMFVAGGVAFLLLGLKYFFYDVFR
jgi:hypothetical protein